MDFSPFLTVAGTLGGTALGAWITHGLARRRTVQDKLWDQRREAYSQIVSHVHKMHDACSMMVDGYNEDASAFYNSTRRNGIIKDMWQSYRDIRLSRTNNILIMSKIFTDAVDSMIKSISEMTSDPDGDDVLYVEDLAKVLEKYKNKLTDTGSSELMGAAGQKR